MEKEAPVVPPKVAAEASEGHYEEAGENRHTPHTSGNGPAMGPRSSFWQGQTRGRPRRLMFCRHGESEANVNRIITKMVPDHDLHLTATGRQQALDAGARIKSLIGDETVKFLVSPYVRTRETLNGILQTWAAPEVKERVAVRADVRLREQEYGNFDRDDIAQLHVEKSSFGAFYYRFPDGESPADCYDRASIFLESLYRSWEDNTFQNFVIVGHGLMILVMMMRLLRLPVEDFELLAGLSNCEFVVLERPADDPVMHIAYTWAHGQEKDFRGLRRVARKRPPPVIWNGDAKAELLTSAPVRSSSQQPSIGGSPAAVSGALTATETPQFGVTGQGDLPVEKRKYIADTLNPVMEELMAECVHAMPDDPRGFILSLLEARKGSK